MSREEVKDRLEKVFREVFDDETILITDETSAEDIDAWDSLTHVELIVAVEEDQVTAEADSESEQREDRVEKLCI